MIFVALGANLPGSAGRTPLETCEWAVARLAGWPGVSVEARSRWYRSAAWPASDQPDYVNGAVRLRTGMAPEAILAMLHAIEAEAGRARSVANAARTLDLDLLAAGSAVRRGPGLVLPHPRLQDRAFVLMPLAEVAGAWVHPLLGTDVAAMAAACDRTGLALLPGQG